MTRRKPATAASRLPSLPLSDENRDGSPVAFRNSQKSQRRIVGSGPHSPSEVGERAGADAIVAAKTAAAVPCPPQEESDSGNLSGRKPTRPGSHPQIYSIRGFPYSADAFTHAKRRSCEPFKDIKKNLWSQRISSALTGHLSPVARRNHKLKPRKEQAFRPRNARPKIWPFGPDPRDASFNSIGSGANS